MPIHIANLFIAGQRLRIGAVTMLEARTGSGEFTMVLHTSHVGPSWPVLFEKLHRASLPVALVKDAKGRVFVQVKQAETFEVVSSNVAAALMAHRRFEERFFFDQGFVDVSRHEDSPKSSAPSLLTKGSVVVAAALSIAALVFLVIFTSYTASQSQRKTVEKQKTGVARTNLPGQRTLKLDDAKKLLLRGLSNVSATKFDQDVLFDGFVAIGATVDVVKTVELGGVKEIDFVVDANTSMRAKFELLEGTWALNSLELD